MPSPELIDFDHRFEQIVRELRATAPPAPESVRARVRELAASPVPDSPLRRRLGGRRVAFVLVPVCLLGLVAGALVAGRGGGGGGSRSAAAGAERKLRLDATATTSAGAVPWSFKRVPQALGGVQHGVAAGGSAAGKTYSPAALPPAQGRLQHYDVSLSLRVRDQDALSKATNEAMQLARGFGGFVAGVEYSSAENTRGDALLTLRVPIGKIDQAIARFSKLGKIRAQHVSIQDLQATVNAQNQAILDTRKSIASLQEKLGGSLPAARRVELQHQLAAQEGRLKALLGGRGQTVREGRLATISLAFTTAKKHAVGTGHPGRIGRAAHDAWTLLARVGAGAVYLVILVGPLLAIGLLLLVIGRALRRRGESRLLARA
ncbi:MAG: hypothetical protein QOE95_1244 [Gaiellaceae bacterium]|jgi:hypothetical protein|nr:hypothetical protein [Gaiellaceae bacterium]